MKEKVKLLLEKSLSGFNIKTTDGEIIGKLVDFSPSRRYAHLSEDHVPTCVRYEGGTMFKMPIGDYILMYTHDKLNFPVPFVDGKNHLEIERSKELDMNPPMYNRN